MAAWSSALRGREGSIPACQQTDEGGPSGDPGRQPELAFTTRMPHDPAARGQSHLRRGGQTQTHCWRILVPAPRIFAPRNAVSTPASSSNRGSRCLHHPQEAADARHRGRSMQVSDRGSRLRFSRASSHFMRTLLYSSYTWHRTTGMQYLKIAGPQATLWGVAAIAQRLAEHLNSPQRSW